MHVGFLDHGDDRALGAPSRLDQTWEVRTGAKPWDAKGDRSDASIPVPFTVPVAVRSALRRSLTLLRSGLLVHLDLHQLVGEEPDPIS